MKLDEWTRMWVRNRSDELSIALGRRFDLRLGSYMIWWCERYLRLYQGEFAGKPFTMNSIPEDSADKTRWPVPLRFDWKDPDVRSVYERRARAHCERVANGEHVDWPYDVHMRLYGWVRFDEERGEWLRRFRRGVAFMGKKNKKSPNIAANALYLTCGDGEPGNRVYMFAKDGTQAKEIAGDHAIEMAMGSPSIRKACRIHKTAMMIKHLRSGSILKPASTGDLKHTEAKHGLNGSALIDEMHVVDKRVDTITRDMGASRRNPMHLGFSTGGEIGAGYGKEKFDLAKRVIDGDVELDNFFGAVFAAPADLTQDDFEKDPVRYCRMANPAMGHTVFINELLSSYADAKHTPIDVASFFQNRLNVFGQAGAMAVRESTWKQIRDPLPFDELGQLERVALGIDMSSNRALTAICAEVQRGTKSHLWWWFWIPRITTKMKKGVPWELLASSGHLTITESTTIDLDDIMTFIKRMSEKHMISDVIFDPHRCGFLTPKLLSQLPATDVISFRQSPKKFHPIIEMMETMIEKGFLAPSPNSCMEWQIDHTRIATDNHGYKYFVKPDHNSDKFNDGLVAMAMALMRRHANGGVGFTPSVYESIFPKDAEHTQGMESWLTQ